MKKTSFLTVASLVVGFSSMAMAEEAATPTQPAVAATPAVETPAQPQPLSPEQMSKNIGYLFGYQTGQQMSQLGPVELGDFDQASFLEGIKAGLAGEKPALPEEAVAQAFQQYQKVIQERIAVKTKENVEAGKKFLEENGKKEGVVTTASGLQYKVLEKGGDKKYEAPKDGDKGTRFLINYKGTLPDGSVFDETRGNPVPMPLEVIPGFKEALMMMPVGAKWDLVIPAALGYGEQGAGGKIGPNQVLCFEIELKDILPPEPAAAEDATQSLSPEQIQQLLEQASKEQAK